jgi:hypothetical protein
MELDIFVPSLLLAFEYNGEQHYNYHYIFGSPEDRMRKDEEKKKLCKQLGITLVEVPYWWDCSKFSLAATICKVKPTLLSAMRGFQTALEQQSHLVIPIPETIPEEYKNRSMNIQSQH